jgi:hypothetical protein
MIPCIIEIVSYTSIICMILLYDTLHYNQPKSSQWPIDQFPGPNTEHAARELYDESERRAQDFISEELVP